MNAMNRKLKDEKKLGNYQKLFLFIVKSCERLLSKVMIVFHKSMNAESVMKKL
jgi:hypothetical protein